MYDTLCVYDKGAVMEKLEKLKSAFLGQYAMASPLTQLKYENDVNLMLSVCEVDSLEKLQHFGENEMAKFYQYAKDKKWSAGTINQRVQCLSMFMKYAVKKHFITENFMEDVKRIRVQNLVHYTPSKNDVEKLLAYIKEHTTQRRMYLMVKLMFAGAFRKSELCNLKVSDLNKEKASVRIVGKGNTIVEQPIPPTLMLELIEYIEKERNFVAKKYEKIGGKDLGYLFMSGIGPNVNVSKKNLGNGNRVNDCSFFQQLKRYAKYCGLENADKISPHSLRRASITEVYNETHDIVTAQEFGRHANISTTQNCYIKYNRDNLKKVVNKIYDDKKEVETSTDKKVIDEKEYAEFLQFLEWKKRYNAKANN